MSEPCARFLQASEGEKQFACEQCFENFPIENGGIAAEIEPVFGDDAEDLADQIESLIALSEAGFAPEIETDHIELVIFWRQTEKQAGRIQNAKLLKLLEFQNDILKAGLHVDVK